MPEENEIQEIVKTALGLIVKSGATGVLQTGLLNCLRRIDGQPLTHEERAYIWGMLESHGWITFHIEPMWHNKRWTATVPGVTAYEAM